MHVYSLCFPAALVVRPFFYLFFLLAVMSAERGERAVIHCSCTCKLSGTPAVARTGAVQVASSYVIQRCYLVHGAGEHFAI